MERGKRAKVLAARRGPKRMGKDFPMSVQGKGKQSKVESRKWEAGGFRAALVPSAREKIARFARIPPYATRRVENTR